MTKALPTILPNSELIWIPSLGIGWHPAPPIDYEGEYWEEYEKRDATEMGRKLTESRVGTVRRHMTPALAVDIGIGAGAFVKEADCLGYDINQVAIKWLQDRTIYRDPYIEKPEAITCWDSLEHIPNPTELLNCVKRFVFMSIPIFKDGESVLKSRHYKPGEHIWYFTDSGIKWFMKEHGFKCIEQHDEETQLGRDGIMTYVFKRV